MSFKKEFEPLITQIVELCKEHDKSYLLCISPKDKESHQISMTITDSMLVDVLINILLMVIDGHKSKERSKFLLEALLGAMREFLPSDVYPNLPAGSGVEEVRGMLEREGYRVSDPRYNVWDKDELLILPREGEKAIIDFALNLIKKEKN